MIDSPLWDFDESRSAIAGYTLSAGICYAGNQPCERCVKFLRFIFLVKPTKSAAAVMPKVEMEEFTVKAQ